MYNKQIAQGKWTEFKGQVQNLWGKITDDELEKAKGDIKQISGLIQQRYGKALGEAKEGLDRKFDSLVSKFSMKDDKK